MNKGWENCYVGLPYKATGRTRDGIDCWGLVRLIHKDQMGIDLPSFDEALTVDIQEELIIKNKENWNKVTIEQAGDVVLFNFMGHPRHVGVLVRPGWFIHASEGQDVRIERLDNPKWAKRIEGIYRYNSALGSNIIGVGHPLKTAKFEAVITPNKTLLDVHNEIKAMQGVSSDYNSSAIIYVNDELIKREDWETFVVKEGSRVEYRAVAGGGRSTGRIIGMIVIAVAAWWAGGMAGAAFSGSAFGSTAATTGMAGMFGAAVSVAVTMVGGMLLNAIFPIRPVSKQDQTNEQGKPTWMLQGGVNQQMKFGAIPVVLGKMRFTPPAAIETYYEAEETTSNLRTVLCWGYGPLDITDIRIGDERLDNYYNVEIETLQGYASDNKTRFDQLYGQDVEQQRVGVILDQAKAVVTSASRTSNVVTVNTSTSEDAHGYLIGQHVDLYINNTFVVGGEIASVSEYSFTFNSSGANGKLNANKSIATTWVTKQLDEEVDELTITFEYPQGLYTVNQDSGAKSSHESQVAIAYKKVSDPSWISANGFVKGITTTLPERPVDRYVENEIATVYQNYQWTSFVVTNDNTLYYKRGDVSRNRETTPVPKILENERELYRCLVNYTDVIQTVISWIPASGLGISVSGLTVTITDGYVDRDSDALHLKKKAISPFSKTIKYNVPRGIYEVKVRNTSKPSGDYDTGTVVFSALTGYKNSKPITFPKPLAMSAIRARATNQINGQIDGFIGTCQSICPDWDSATQTWITRPTSNPASLYRYVLQHPANAKRCSDAGINLTELQEWHEFCTANNFEYNNVINNASSLYEVMKDIAAAGRASPTRIDAKWSVIVDKPRDSIIQHFTPHNSWGFEGSKSLPKMPHAFRVTFNNEDKGYQPDERIVYDDGYNESNATLFEGLAFPGVTRSSSVFKHARMHLAQIKLRPETYVLNTDLEHLVCNRGDLVRVTHDVPMWGLGSGRVKSKLSSTSLLVDEALGMQAGKQYGIRFRCQDGSSVVKTVVAKSEDGYFNQIDLTSALDSDEGLDGDLFLYGEINQESVDLIVIGVEPSTNLTARLTLVDYSPAIYDSDLGVIPPFDSKITLQPGLLRKAITQVPENVVAQSGDYALIETSPGSYKYGLRLNWTNPINLPADVTHVEAQIDWYGDNTIDWLTSVKVPVSNGTVLFEEVDKNENYVYHLRYVDTYGRTGKWTDEGSTTIEGRTRPPVAPTEFRYIEEFGSLQLTWNTSSEFDVKRYEVRTQDSDWGINNQYRVYYGDGIKAYYSFTNTGVYNFYVRSVSDDGVMSESVSISYNYNNNVDTSTLVASFHDTSLTTATVTLDWEDVSTTFGTKGYEVSYGSVTKFVNANTVVLPADWIGDRVFTIKTVDNFGAVSNGKNIAVTKLRPNPPTAPRAQIIDNNVMLYWTNADKTTLPISHVNIKKGDVYATATEIGTKSGAFTVLTELQGGNFTYWLTSVDTDGYESDPISIAAKVAEPPDFIFRGAFESTLNGTLSNAVKQDNSIILPVNTSETFQGHFTSRSWNTPQDQINTGYPIFIQPGYTTGYYQETFDFGTVLPSSKVTLSYAGSIVSGSPVVISDIEVSLDGSSWTLHTGVTDVFENSFRYVRVTVHVTGDSYTLYSLNTLNVRCDAKQKTDSMSQQCLSTDTGGTVYNFNREFVDVESIILSASATTSVTAVYDFKDVILTGTYSVSSNVVTCNINAHGLIAGQKVKLTSLSGLMANQIVTVSTASTNSFTANCTSANTSGNLQAYWQSFRVYAFDSNGTRVTATVSANVRGY